MRVLQLNLQSPGTGADRCARELYQRLPAFGVQCAMWVADRNPDDDPAVRAIRSRWERHLFPLETFPDLTDWRHRGTITALGGISKADFDLVHIHNIHSGLISVRAVHDLTKRFPCVWTLHDEWAPTRGMTYNLIGKISPREAKRLSRGPIRYIPYHRYHDNFKWRRTRRFLDCWMPQPKAVICPSRYMADLATASGVFPSSQIIHIPNGTAMPEIPNTKMSRAEAKRSFSLASDQPLALMISADLAQAHKGIDLGIRAIKRADPQARLKCLLLGHAASKIAESLLPIKSISTFASNDNDLARAYRAADVTICPSLGENLPYVALESLACGTPVLAFPVGGMPEIIGQNERGVVCSTIDAAEMGAHLAALISNPTMRQEMGKRGKQWIQSTCSMTGYLTAITSLYERIVSETGGLVTSTQDGS